ncbi:hypothetical protein HZS_6514 [Henneguya salminicola]|nr:hypothetical protein HZS_6514 [Henneguya salminicola]
MPKRSRESKNLDEALKKGFSQAGAYQLPISDALLIITAELHAQNLGQMEDWKDVKYATRSASKNSIAKARTRRSRCRKMDVRDLARHS